MSQLILFDDLPIKFEDLPEIRNVDNRSLIDVVKEMNKLNLILGKEAHYLPHEHYEIFKTGGKHFWGDKNQELFGGNDYPFVINNKTGKVASFSIANKYYPTLVYQIEVGSMSVVTLLFHRMVATAFIENPLNKALVDHIDGNPANYKTNNLILSDGRYFGTKFVISLSVYCLIWVAPASFNLSLGAGGFVMFSIKIFASSCVAIISPRLISSFRFNKAISLRIL
jgi:hypothetical protein